MQILRGGYSPANRETLAVFAIHHIFVLSSVLLLFSVLASKISGRFGVPALLMFLGVGMLAGSDGPGGIYFDDVSLANTIGTVALAFILFSGGLDTDWRSIRPVLGRGVVLSTFGVAFTALFVGVFAWLALDFSLLEGLLLGSIVSSTDAAAVFSILRSRQVSLKGNLKPLLELESGSNDPMAVFLTVGFLQLLTVPDKTWLEMLLSFGVRMSCGAVVGLVIGKLSAFLFNRIRLDYEGLYPVLGLSVVILTYGAAETFHGNGFLAVYLCGIVLGNSDFLYKRSLMRFHDGLGWLMQIGMFLVLGLLVFPSRLSNVAGSGLALAAFLMFAARPAAVYLCLWKSRFSIPERTLIAWAGLRGAVPIVLATFPLLAGYSRSSMFFNQVFFIVLASVLLQGKFLMPLARRLKVDRPLITRPKYPLEFDRTEHTDSQTREIELFPDSTAVGKTIAQLGLPPDVLILLVRRGNAFVVPRGQTILEPYDTLLLLAAPASLAEANNLLLVRSPESSA